MNDTNKSFSFRRVGCLLSYSFREWREWYLYLPLGCLLIGLSHIIHSIYVLNPRRIESGQPYDIVNVSNFMDNAGGFNIIFILFLVLMCSMMLAKFKHKGKSSFYRSMPTTALEKMISLFMEFLIIIFLIVSMKILSLILDGIICTIYNYNEWKDILPAIKDFFTPELSIRNGEVSFGFRSYRLLDENWVSNKWFIRGVSFNDFLYKVIFFFLFPVSMISNTNRNRTKSKISSFRMSKGLYIIIISSFIILNFILASKFREIFGMIFGYGPWCYNYEYGWMIQTFVLLAWLSYWLCYMYSGIKRGEAK